MRRVLINSNAFVRASKKMLKKKPKLAYDLKEALKHLEEDAYQPLLRTHKLTGILEGSWACSAGYDLRIIFCFVTYQGKNAILLQTVGTHDEVY